MATIEVGHIFKLGRKYTEALGISVLGPDGGRVVPITGSYGTGVERALAAIVETHHDDKGIVWPVSVAPFEVAVVVLGGGDAEAAVTAESLYRRLRDERIDVLLDDRDERPGVKFRDAGLVGIPYRVTVGARGLAGGTVEVTTRATGETRAVPVAEAAEHVRKLLTAAV
ncbi:His/Gly/Thr/Pro-type tRNA ligase C-terminal domain-containing protein [Kitasatospora sp. NPDC056531]|uniref:His/Gly/Thr/Pro-type tRNA ligase C-terminal domain-containing protein n=1 Tax=Kitasatospora sp. NPDC056531 TaxID=3345856 RepID=UPI0036A7D1E6